MGVRREIAVGAATATLVVGALLYVPERTQPPTDVVTDEEFSWPNIARFRALESEFDRNRGRSCEEVREVLDRSNAALDAAIATVEANPRIAPIDPAVLALENTLFNAAPLYGGCPERTDDFSARVVRLRRVIKVASQHWPLDQPPVRDQLYRLLYGARAALEELWIANAASAEALLASPAVPSRTPSREIHGVTLHSGDILLSRGGAPTSALISRGNNYPGNFSHVALVHIDERGATTVVEAHIESGLGSSTVERYLRDTKLRIMVLRLRPDHPRLRDDPQLPHHAAETAMAWLDGDPVGYDFAMDYAAADRMFCSEVAFAAYQTHGVRLWPELSSLSSAALVGWLSSLGVEHFETLAPSDLEYDPQLWVVAEWRDPETLMDDHLDNAVLDGMLATARGEALPYSYARLGPARLLSTYSRILNWTDRIGPVPEGMSATVALRVAWLRTRHAENRAHLERAVQRYRRAHGRPPAYWTMVDLAGPRSDDRPESE